MDLIVANPSLGDALAYTMPIAKALDKPNLLCSDANVEKILSGTPYFGKGDAGDRVIFTGGPGFHEKSPYCPRCSKVGRCDICGKSSRHHQMCLTLMKQHEECFGEWYEYLRPLNAYGPTTERYRPKKILEAWGMDFEEISLDLDWYSDHYVDFRCSDKSVLINLESSSQGRSLDAKLLSYIPNDWDVRFIDCARDVRENLFLINQVRHVVTVDTSTVWLAKCLSQKNIHVICPGGLNRHLDLGCERFITDSSTRYCDIELSHIVERLKGVMQ